MIYIIVTLVKVNDAGENQKIDSPIRRTAKAHCKQCCGPLNAKCEITHDTIQSHGEKKEAP